MRRSRRHFPQSVRHTTLAVLSAIALVLILAQLIWAAAGSLDPTFGSGGRALTDFSSGSTDDALAIAIQPSDGKIVVVGMSDANDNGDFDFAVSRYNTDGTLDTSFGTGGIVLTDFADGSDDEAFGVAIQPADGKIVVVGLSDFSIAVARYSPDGTLDASFGKDHTGKVTTNFTADSTDLAVAVSIQPADGKIIVAGRTDANFTDQFALVRYNPDGTPDKSFNSDGKIIVPWFSPNSSDDATAVAIPSDGKIVVVGTTTDANGSNQLALVRYRPTGTL